MPRATQLSRDNLEVSAYPESPFVLNPCALQPPVYMAFLPRWASGIKEPRRFSAGRSLLITSGIISLSPEFEAKRGDRGDGTCAVSLRLELGSLLSKPGAVDFSGSPQDPHLPPLSPDSLWILTTGVNSATWAGRNG